MNANSVIANYEPQKTIQYDERLSGIFIAMNKFVLYCF